MSRDLGISQSITIRTLWSCCQLCPGENEGDAACSNAYSVHSCSRHSSAFDSEVKPPEWQLSVCWEGKLFICCQVGWCDWGRQPVSWGEDWSQRAGGTPIGSPALSCPREIQTAVEWFLRDDACSVFHSWPSHPCSANSAPDPRADWGAASDIHGGAKETI